MSRDEKKYQPVSEMDAVQRTKAVKDIFSTIHRRYDLANRLFSLRRDQAWRRRTAKKMVFFKTNRLLDVATGTADIAIEAAKTHRGIDIIGIDFVLNMMLVGAQKVRRLELQDRIHFVAGDALALPFPDNHFDCASIAFGIRNIPDKKRALEEMRRIVVPGGRVLVLEMNFPQIKWMQNFYSKYIRRILPGTARLFTDNPAAYDYLADSIIHFPSPIEFMRMMAAAGLDAVEKHSLTMGITHLYIGTKL